jgi:hypothetical protein
MPFTPAHTVIVLPFLRVKPTVLSATGLVIGSVAPDFEYFFKMSVNSTYSHTLLGVLYFNVPVSIALAFLFHGVIKKNFITNLPAFLQKRFQSLLRFDFVSYFRTHFFVFIFSAALGSLSHIFWDAFTHNDGFFAQRISLYRQVVIPFDGVNYPLFYGLQHISTYTGLAILVVYITWMKPDAAAAITLPQWMYWAVLLVVSGLILVLRFAFRAERFDLGNFVVSSITALIIGMSVAGLHHG